MKKFKQFFGYGWAMPVVSRPWAVIASFFDVVKRVSGYRIGAVFGAKAWERAVGVNETNVSN